MTLTDDGAETLRNSRARRTAYLARRLDRLDAEQLRTLERAAVLLELLTEDDPEQVGPTETFHRLWRPR